jgi:hypothetical protein
MAAVALVVLIGVAVWLLGRGGTPRTAPPVSTTAAASPPARQRQAPKPAPSGAPPTLLISATRGNCWLLVKTGSATGPTVYEQTLQQGQSVRFALGHRLWVRIGAPWNLDATIAGRSVTRALPAATGNVLATAAGLQPAP